MPEPEELSQVYTADQIDDNGDPIIIEKAEKTDEVVDVGKEVDLNKDDKDLGKEDELKADKPLEFSNDNLDPEIKDEEKSDEGKSDEGKDVDKYGINELFGEGVFNSVDEIKNANIPSVLKEHKELKAEVQKYNQIIDQYKEKIKQLASPFASDNLKKINSFVKSTGIDDPYIAGRMLSVDIKELGDKEAIILNELLKDPDLVANRSLLEKKIDRTYKLGDYRPFKEDSNEEGEAIKKFYDDEDALGDMKIDAIKAKKELSAIKAKIKDEDVNIEELMKINDVNTEEIQKTLQPIIPEILKRIESVPLLGGKGIYKIDKTWLDNQVESLLNDAVSNNLKFDTTDNAKQSAERIYNTVVDRFYRENRKNIETAIFNLGRKSGISEIKKIASNPSGGTPRDTKHIKSDQENNGVKTADQAYQEAMQ